MISSKGVSSRFSPVLIPLLDGESGFSPYVPFEITYFGKLGNDWKETFKLFDFTVSGGGFRVVDEQQQVVFQFVIGVVERG